MQIFYLEVQQMYEIIEKLCNEHGITITNLCKQVTGSSGNLSTWKKGYMRSDYLKKVADILNVSADQLLDRANPQYISGNVFANGSDNVITNNSNNISNPSAIEDDEVWDTYSKLSTKDKLEIKLDILNRGNK